MSKLKVDELEESTSGQNITVASGTNLVVTDSLTVGGAAPYTAGGTDVAVADGGTGAGTATAGFDALSPMTTVGDIMYGGSSGTVTRLAASTDGHVLTATGAGSAPAWEAVAGAWNFISSTALDAASITVTGLDSTYDKYQFVLSNVHCDGSSTNYVRARAVQGGSPVASDNYIFAGTMLATQTSTCNAYHDTGTSYFELASDGTSTPTAEGLDITLDIYHPASTTTWLTAYWEKVGHTHDDRNVINVGGGQLKTTAATTGIQFLTANGAFDGGNVRLYGLASS
jgi:hypothetical protein